MASQQAEDRSHWPITVLSGLSSLINMFLPLFLVRILSPEAIGFYKIFFLYLVVAPGLSMIAGVTSGLAYWAGQKQGRPAIQASSLFILGAGVLLSSLAFIFSGPLTQFLGWDYHYTLIFAFALLGTVSGGFFEEAAISTGRVWSGAIAYAGFEIVRTLSLVTVAVLTRDVTSVFLTHAAMVTFKVLVTYSVGIKLKLVGFDINRQVVRSVWNYAFPVSLAWVFGVFVERADQLILSTLISRTDFAFYSVGCLIVPPLFTLEHSITRVLIPQLSECFAEKNDSRASRLYSEAVESLAFLFFPAVIGLILFSEPIIQMLFTKQYISAAKFLDLFALSYLALVFPNDAVPRAKGQANWILKNFSIFSIVSLILAYLLTVQFGPFGALASLLFSKAAMRIYAMRYIHVATGWGYRTFLPVEAFARILIICALLAGVCLLVKPIFASPLLWLAICGPLFAILYFPLVLFLKTHSERRQGGIPRVMILTQCLPIGGLEKMVFDLARAINQAGKWQPFVIAYDQDVSSIPQGFIPALRLAGIPLLLWKKPEGFSLYTPLKLLSLILRYDIRVVHSHNIGPLIYACIAKILLLGQIKIVHTQHSFLHLSEKKKYTIYERVFSLLVDELVVVAPDMQETYLRWGIPKKRLHTITNGIHVAGSLLENRTQRLSERSSLLSSISSAKNVGKLLSEPEAIWILYLARLHSIKGQRAALPLWGHLAPEVRTKCFLIFVGPEAEDRELETLTKLTKEIPDADRVIFAGGTHDSAKWYRASDLFLSCSAFEGLPLAPLEALSNGLPVVLSEIPGHNLLVDKASTFPLTDLAKGSQVLTDVITQVANGEPSDLVQSRSKWVKQSFSLDRMASEYTALYGPKRPQHTGEIASTGKGFQPHFE